MNRARRLLAEAIVGMMTEGVMLDRRAQDYLDATFSHPSPRRLAAVLADANDCEKEPLEHFLFSADPGMQARLEPMIEALPPHPDDAPWLDDKIAAVDAVALFLFPDGRELRIAVTRERAACFTAGLRLHRRLDPKIRRAIDERVAPSLQNRAKVRLRYARRPVPETHHLFWLGFFEQFGSRPTELENLLDTALYVLDAAAPTVPASAFARCRTTLMQALEQIAREDAFRQGKNMETLILMGNRFPHADPDDIRRRICDIDRIAMAVLGGLPPDAAAVQTRPGAAVETLADVNDLIRRLS